MGTVTLWLLVTTLLDATGMVVTAASQPVKTTALSTPVATLVTRATTRRTTTTACAMGQKVRRVSQFSWFQMLLSSRFVSFLIVALSVWVAQSCCSWLRWQRRVRYVPRRPQEASQHGHVRLGRRRLLPLHLLDA